MFNYQIIHKKCLLWVTLVFVCLNSQFSYAQQQKETSIEEVKVTIRNKVIPALEALEAQLPITGRGTAIMETENYLPWFDGKELTMDFVFKGQNSRWDAIEWVDGNKSSRLWARVAADKYMVTLASDDTVTVNRAKVHDFFRNDFHPVSFVSFNDYLLRSQLQDILDYDLAADPEKYASADLDDNGILHIVDGGPVTRPKGLYFEHQMSFDTKRELVPVFLKGTIKEQDRTDSTIVRLEWTKYGSTWYVSRVECSIEPSNRHHRIFTIKDFSPNVEVSDNEFTLDGLDIPEGMMVIDKPGGVTYRYQAHKIQEQQADGQTKLSQDTIIQPLSEVNGSDTVSTNIFYLRSCKTGRLIGPVSLKPGTVLPPLDETSYIVAEPTESELQTRKYLLETNTFENHFIDCDLPHVAEMINFMLKRGSKEKAPTVRIDTSKETKLALISMSIKKEPAYNVLFKIAAQAQLHIFIEDDAIILSSKELRETTHKNTNGNK